MTMISRRFLSILALGTALAPPAFAQEAPEKNGEQASIGDVIIVTGTRRDTSLQHTDLSVTVVNRQMLDQARIRDIRQLDAVAPNVKFNESGQLGSTYISIRGIESNPFIVNRAAVYIDGIPFRELSGAVLNQVESVEVLRGPQATLYGANSESGLVIINTRAPTDHLVAEARATGAAFSGGHNGMLDGFIGGPLAGDALAGSVAFKISQGDSFLRNIQPGRNPGEIGEKFLQGRLRWRPTDRLTVNTTAYILDTRAPGLFSEDYVPFDVDLYNRTYADANNGGRRIGNFSYINDTIKRANKREIVAGGSATYDLGYGSLTGALSYRHLKEDSRGFDLDVTAANVGGAREYKKKDFWNAELRFASPASKPFNYIVGFNHYRQDSVHVQGTYNGPDQFNTYGLTPPQLASARDWGAFLSTNWTPIFLPKLTLGAGIRYDHAHRDTQQRAGQLVLGDYTLVYRPADLSGNFEQALPRFSVRYEPSSQLTLYANVAKGYIPGGFNLTAVQEDLTGSVLRYQSETLWSHEGGFKWRSADRRVRLGGAVFYIRANNWQEIQVATDSSGRIISSSYIGSNASIDSKGFELEASAEPVHGLTLTANFGYTDARYRDLQLDATTNMRGQRVKLVPAYNGYLAARYQTDGGLFARAEMTLTGKETLDSYGQARQPATQEIGLQAGYERPHWSARLFVENLTNVRRHSGLAFRNFTYGNDGNWYSPVERSRQGGIELEWKL